MRWLATGLAAAVLSVVVVVIAWALFAPAADWLARHDVGSATGTPLETARNNARGSLLTLGAGVVATGALIFTARNFALQRRTHELTEQGQVTDRYTKAIEQLGSDKLDIRIGGIYALERIARDSARDHPTVMEVLTAFIREHSHEQWPPPDHPLSQEGRSTRPDIQAALTVVGRRDQRRDIPGRRWTIDLTGAYLTGADLWGAELSDVNFSYANLSRAILTRAILTRAHLTGADLTGAYLAYADLSGAGLAFADLTGADLNGTVFGEVDLANGDVLIAGLTDARWPAGAPVPEGWTRDPASDRLKRTITAPAPTEENSSS
jgi:hypothetical protein